MKWKPAKYENRTSTGHPLRYVVAHNSGKSWSCCIMVERGLASKAGLKEGSSVRCDLDKESGHARIVEVLQSQKKLAGKSTGSVVLHLPWNNDIKEVFPVPGPGEKRTRPLVFVEATKNEGLIFELPRAAAKAEKRKG